MKQPQIKDFYERSTMYSELTINKLYVAQNIIDFIVSILVYLALN